MWLCIRNYVIKLYKTSVFILLVFYYLPDLRVQMAMLRNLRWQGPAGGLYELKSASIR